MASVSCRHWKHISRLFHSLLTLVLWSLKSLQQSYYLLTTAVQKRFEGGTSVQFSSVPWLIELFGGGTWWTIQQWLSCSRPLSALMAWAGISTLWCCPLLTAMLPFFQGALKHGFGGCSGVRHAQAIWVCLLTSTKKGSCGPTNTLILLCTQPCLVLQAEALGDGGGGRINTLQSSKSTSHLIIQNQNWAWIV